MDTSEKFARFASECEGMAKLSRTPDNKALWRRMAERWRRCAELNDIQTSATSHRPLVKRH